MNSDSMSVGGPKNSIATTFNAMQGTQRNYWKYAAIPTGSLLVISLVAIGVLLAFYNPWTAAAALAAAGGYPILAIPAAFAVIGLVGFVISSTGWILRHCHKKAIQEEAYAVSPTSDTESEESEETDDDEGGTLSSSSSSTDEPSSSESSEGKIEKSRRKVEDLTDVQAKESESSSSTSFSSVSEAASTYESSSSSEPELTPDEVRKQTTKIVEQVFTPIMNNLGDFLQAVILAHGKANRLGDVSEEAEEGKQAVLNLWDTMQGFFTNDYFVLKNALSHLLGFEGTSRIRRQIAAAVYAKDEDALSALLPWYETLVAKQTLYGIVPILQTGDIQKIRTELPKEISQCFERDDKVMIQNIEDLITSLFNNYDDEKLLERLPTIPLQGARESSLDYHAKVARLLKDAIYEMFDEAWESGDADIQKALEGIASRTRKHLALDIGIGAKVSKIVKMVAKGLGVLDIYLSDKDYDEHTIKEPLFYHLYYTENSELMEHDFEKDAAYKNLLAIQKEINEVRYQAAKKKRNATSASIKNASIALVVIPVNHAAEDSKTSKAIEILLKDEIALSPKEQTKLRDLDFGDSYKIVAIRCQQQGGVNELAMFKQIEKGNLRKFLNTIDHRLMMQYKDTLMPAVINALSSYLNVQGTSGGGFVGKVVKWVLQFILFFHKEKLRKLNLKGLTPEKLQAFHKAFFDLLPYIFVPAIDAFFAPRGKNKFKDEVVTQLGFNEGDGFLKEIKNTLSEIADVLQSKDSNSEGEINEDGIPQQWVDIKEQVGTLIQDGISQLQEYSPAD